MKNETTTCIKNSSPSCEAAPWTTDTESKCSNKSLSCYKHSVYFLLRFSRASVTLVLGLPKMLSLYRYKNTNISVGVQRLYPRRRKKNYWYYSNILKHNIQKYRTTFSILFLLIICLDCNFQEVTLSIIYP